MEVTAVTGILDTTLALIFTWVGYKTTRILWKYTPYSYPNARIMAMEARLFSEQKFNELAESKTLNNFVINLEDSDYRDYLANLPSYDAESIDRALDKALAGIYSLMFKILPKRVNPFFRLLLQEWDVRNIASAVKAKIRGEPAVNYITDLGTMPQKVKAIADSKSMEEILVILEGTEYEEIYQKLLLGEIGVDEFETQLYKMHYSKLLEYAESRKDEEKVILEEFVRLRIDKLNILTILRAKAHGLKAELIKPSLIPGGTLNRKTIDTLLNVEDLGMALAELDSTKYGEIIRNVREEAERDLSVLDRELERYIRQRLRELTRFYPLSVAVPLNFLLQKEAEVKKLKAIAKLIEDSIPPERIKEIVGELT